MQLTDELLHVLVSTLRFASQLAGLCPRSHHAFARSWSALSATVALPGEEQKLDIEP